jgi:putative transposase
LFGKSRQGYYQRKKYVYTEQVKSEILLQMVAKQRKLMPRVGGRKLLRLIQPQLPEELYLGRDAFFDFLREMGLLVRKRRNRTRTTWSNHWLRKYPNLIMDFTPTGPNQMWVSDITYVETSEGFGYLSLITDAYSRKIIGWCLGSTLEAKHSIQALQMAIKQLPRGSKDVYHHSDRGVQYCSDEYVKLLKKHRFKISMTERGDPRDNSIAERVNGILKDEWLNQMKLNTIEEARNILTQIIRVYNGFRPHSSVDFQTPNSAHTMNGPLKRHWKNYYRKKEAEELIIKTDSFVEPNKVMVTR